ncbi:hypothetical protein [Amycolatopsis sp. NPDC051903]|uniref:hypothetical protein n=1 Tax=Amycolatopsis sp. NPDC051903 TaxID=3363936 RepID=UPI0037959205
MSTLLLALIGPAGFGLAFGGAYLHNQLRHRPIGERAEVWNRHTYRLACRQVERQARAELWFTAWEGATAICVWLTNERRYGSARRQAWFNQQLAAWTLKCGEFNPLANATASAGR